MSDTVLCAFITLCGSGLGALVGIIINSKLSNYRIEQLEKKVDKHNNLIERMFSVESTVKVLDEQVKNVNCKISDLENSAYVN